MNLNEYILFNLKLYKLIKRMKMIMIFIQNIQKEDYFEIFGQKKVEIKCS